MSKTKISEYSATANSNTDVGGINIDEGCAPSGINDAIRTLMAQLKNFQTGASGDTITVGGVLTVTGGSAAAPALTTSGDTNTGVLFPAADTIALTTGGTERARIDSSGNLGIGTSSPGAKLDVNSGTNSEMRVTTSGSGYLQVGQFTNGAFIGTSSTDATAGLLRFGTGGSVRATIDGSGNLGLGVTPSAWSTYKSFQLPDIGFFGSQGPYVQMIANAYYNGTNYTRITANQASMYAQAVGQHQWHTAGSSTAGSTFTFTQAMTLDASGNLGVGSTSPNIAGVNKAITLNTTNGTSGAIYEIAVSGTNYAYLFANSSNTVLSSVQNLPLLFNTNNTERARIDSSGNLLVGRTDAAAGNVGGKIASTGFIEAVVNADACISANRKTDDGVLVLLQQQNTTEGTISVSGTTVSYNGGHLARFAQTVAVKDESIKKGTVLSNLDEMNTYTDSEGNAVANEQLNKVKISDVEGDSNVAGVFVNWSHDDQHNIDEINMAMTGDMIIRISQGTTVARGDLLMSAGNGTAKPQGDDIVRSKTVAKVTSTHVTCTYEDGSFCVPCVLMAC